MRVLILGGNGMLGHKLVQVFGRDFDTFTTIRREFAAVGRFGIFDKDKTITGVDVTSPDQLACAIGYASPDVVINCVGVIKQVASLPETMVQINTLLPRLLAELSAKFSFRLISMSTDCVFSGTSGNRIESDPADATDAYGQTKLHGEVIQKNCLTIRSSIIGRELDTKHSLIEWFLSKQGQTVGGYSKAIYSGFPTIVFAEILRDLIRDHRDLSGLFHISSEPINKYDLLWLVNEAFEARVIIEPDESFVIDRSLDSEKFQDATGFISPSWPDMIERMADDPTPYELFHSAG